MDVILNGLNNAQKDAVTSSSSILQVLAPPGSGKTKTLTARVAYLLTHYGYAPWDIICCTFTVKAAREMRERLRGLIGEGLESKLILGTFHSICRRYLVRYGNKIGLPKGFGIADSADSISIVKRVIKRRKIGIDPSTARSRISHRKARGVSYDEDTPSRAGNKCSVEQQQFRLVFTDYEDELKSTNLLDYDDLLLRCLELLQKHPECVSNVQAVLIDEFQDTNTVQFELMKLFSCAKSRITIVGDPDQSIYSFRAAEVANLLHMQRHYVDTNVIHLEENYRSCGAILSSAQDIIEQDTSRPNKRLKATHAYGSLPTFRRLPSAFAEASWIVIEIQRLIALSGKMLNYSDFVILLRSAALSRLIESAMGKAGVPYRMVGGFRFFDRVEVRILLDYLRTICQPQNNDAFLAVINVPARGIGDKTIKDLVEEADAAKIPLFTFVRDIIRSKRTSICKLRTRIKQNLASLVEIVFTAREKMTACASNSAPKVLLQFLIEKLFYKEFIEKTYREDPEARWTNVEELLAQAEDITSLAMTAESEALPAIEGVEQQESDGGQEALARFLANIALSSEVQTDDDGSQQRVTISTIHAAKGLEWPVVFIPALYEGSIPHSRAEDTDEERRLLYVAMTRAQGLLYLSHPFRGSRSNEETKCSQFIAPRSLTRFFQEAGPVINDELLRCLARSLRRELPREGTIVEEMQKLRSLHDDLWPLTGEPGEEEQRRWAKPATEQFRSRESSGVGDYQTSYTVSSTMDQIQTFSMPNANLSTGFTTAAHHMQTVNVTDKEPLAADARHFKAPVRIEKPRVKPSDQKGIASFFGTSPKKGEVSSVSSVVDTQITQPDHRPKQSSKDSTIVAGCPPRPLLASGSPHHSVPKTQPTSKVPHHLLSHRLPPTGNQILKRPRPLTNSDDNFRRKRHDLHSSSPPPEPCDSQGNRDKENVTQPTRNDGFEPVLLNQQTTMMKLQQNQSQGTGVGRKTYGIRRSMNGWADRMKRAM